MIGKIVTGKSFGGAVRYLLGKEPGKAYILTSDGVELTSRQALIGSFEFQRRARPDVERVVGHISLSFHPDDDPRMSNQLMIDLAREYMQRMEITGTQHLVVRHTDTKHPHVHILYGYATIQRWYRTATNACATCVSAGSSSRSTG
ncbi:relaxase/mobilization nuclease domain-containing protein [uncultured Alistipes sp.]|uniref:relaxase/mobilization nuclease domain-containing protein n=1 Tax=uncultured Alistipes sp. TaxID=538949 RepID=UPI0026236B26|nr:relaxase/mobilization nuclease domain-containing protein [uncultured Alistipes sp.]